MAVEPHFCIGGVCADGARCGACALRARTRVDLEFPRLDIELEAFHVYMTLVILLGLYIWHDPWQFPFILIQDLYK